MILHMMLMINQVQWRIMTLHNLITCSSWFEVNLRVELLKRDKGYDYTMCFQYNNCVLWEKQPLDGLVKYFWKARNLKKSTLLRIGVFHSFIVPMTNVLSSYLPQHLMDTVMSFTLEEWRTLGNSLASVTSNPFWWWFFVVLVIAAIFVTCSTWTNIIDPSHMILTIGMRAVFNDGWRTHFHI